MRYRTSDLVLLVLLSILVGVLYMPFDANGLPFNDDMVDMQYRTGTVVRPKPKGSVVKGSLKHLYKTKQEAMTAKNPFSRTEGSVLRGRMLFSINCRPCHGNIESPKYTPGPVASKFMPPPDISSKYYRDKQDGYFYATIHFGGLAVMPPFGWRLSWKEHWDLVNYIRYVQEKKGSN